MAFAESILKLTTNPTPRHGQEIPESVRRAQKRLRRGRKEDGGRRRKEEGGKRKEERGKRKEEGRRRKDEGEKRKEQEGRRKEEGRGRGSHLGLLAVAYHVRTADPGRGVAWPFLGFQYRCKGSHFGVAGDCLPFLYTPHDFSLPSLH